MNLDVLASVTLSDETAISDLAGALADAECLVEQTDRNRLDVALPWGSAAAGTLDHAWREVVFFLRAWQANHHEIVLRVEDVRFARSGGHAAAADAA